MRPHQHQCINAECNHVWTHVEPTHGWRSGAQFDAYHTCPKCGTCAVDAGGGCDKYYGPKPVEPSKPYNIVDAIVTYEEGDSDYDATIELFQHLVDSGLAWKLQGSYARIAADLIRHGLITENRRNG